jgi:hypothetical protein
MTIYATAGSKLYIGGALAMKSADFVESDFTSQTWTEIGGLTGLGKIGDSSEAISVKLVGEARTKKMKGTRDAGTQELVCAADAADAGQAALIAAQATKDSYAFKLVFNDAPPARSAPVTMTIATPGVIGLAAHGLVVGNKIQFSTTGALPTGLTAGTTYFVKTVVDANSFTVSATNGGNAITTSGTQSGTHTGTTVPNASERKYIALVMSAEEQLDGADNEIKLNVSLAVNSNAVRIVAST